MCIFHSGTTYRPRSHRLLGGLRTLSTSLCLLTAGTTLTFAQGLVEKVIGTSRSSITSFSINDRGWATWTTGQHDSSQLYLWNGKKTTTLGFDSRNNRDARINNNNWIVWSAYRDDLSTTDIFLSKSGGKAIVLSTEADVAAQPVINNRNQVAFWGQAGGSGINDLFYWNPNTKKLADITQYDAEGASSGPMLNDAGQISWERATENYPGGEVNLVSSSLNRLTAVNNFDKFPSAFKSITNRSDLNLINGGLNNHGKMVWVEYNDALSKYDIWQYDPKEGMARNLTEKLDGDSMNPVLNDQGVVAWYTSDKHHKHYDLYWDSGNGATEIPISGSYSAYPLALNNTGGLVYALGDGTSTGYQIVLAQIPGAVPEPGTVALAGAFVTGGLLLLRRKARRR